MNSSFSPLNALSPLDGRYSSTVSLLTEYFSELALNKFRIQAELEYILFFIEKILEKGISNQQREQVLEIVTNFNLHEAEKLKQLEQETKHDVKAIEYYLRDKFTEISFPFSEYIHFGLTSEDINSIAYGLALKNGLQKVVFPSIESVISQLTKMADEYKSIPMLARTHGQPAVPTTVGKELVYFAQRLHSQFTQLKQHPIEAKITGAVGNFNALQLSYPNVDWTKESDVFIQSLGFQPNHFTTQIVPSESYLQVFQKLELINSIIIDLNQDMWRYISDGYFIQNVQKNEVGSSTMPQKVNPIDFENSEGNLGLANSLLHFFIQKLPISRLQRDLSDSTVKRNFGSALGYCLIGYKLCLRGLEKVSPNSTLLESELNNHWEVVTEGVQTLLRLTGDEQAYEKLKDFSRGKKVTKEKLKDFINSLKIDHSVKEKLLALSPLNYLGLSIHLTEVAVKEINESSK